MNARLVQTFALLAVASLAVLGGRRLRVVRRWTRGAARTVAEDVEALFI